MRKAACRRAGATARRPTWRFAAGHATFAVLIDRPDKESLMTNQRIGLALACLGAALATGCAIAPPEPEVAQANVPEPSLQKCATVTGSRLATTCSNMVKSSSNKAAMREMQRHAPLEGGK
jgi:hypothetical protein